MTDTLINLIDEYAAPAKACVCGEPQAPGTVHRVDGPCYVAEPQQEVQEPGEITESIERMATGRYKVVPSHESMFHRWAVVAGSGTQQLYLGREVECQNMARKFAGAFVAMQSTAPQQEAQEPVGEVQHLHELNDSWLNKLPIGTKLYTAPQPAPAPLSDDVVQKTWALIDELEKLRGADRYDEDWVTLNKRDSELRAAIAAQGGK